MSWRMMEAALLSGDAGSIQAAKEFQARQMANGHESPECVTCGAPTAAADRVCAKCRQHDDEKGGGA
jgi:hypothetical protein